MAQKRKNSRSNSRRRDWQPIYARLWFWVAVCILIIVFIPLFKWCTVGKWNTSSTQTPPEAENDFSDNSAPNGTLPTAGTRPETTERPTQEQTQPTQAPPTQPETTATEPPSAGPDYYETRQITAGNYRIGTEIPAGTADICAISGTGSVASSDGVIAYAAFGEGYATEKSGVVLRAGASLTVTGTLTLRFAYSTEPVITGAASSGTGDVYTLAGGGDSVFTVGADFAPGTYDISVLSGYGEVVTSDAQSGSGISEMMGEADDGGNYLQEVKNVVLNDGVRLTVRNCTVKLTRTN